MTLPTISVVMPNYNHAHYISEALEAILSQSLLPLEVIVIDDASTDNSIEVIEAISKKSPIIRLIRNEVNRGIIHNINKGLAYVAGDYVCFQSADDKVLPTFFEKSIRLLKEYPDAGLCSTRTLCIDAQGRNMRVLPMPMISNKACYIPPEKAIAMLHSHGSWIQGNTTTLRRCALVESGGYVPELHSFCDGFVQLVMAAKYGACYIPEPLTAWRQLENSYSGTIANNPELSLQYVHHAKRLMQTTYSDLFLPDFVDRWEKRELLNCQLSRYLHRQIAALDKTEQDNPFRSYLNRGLLALKKLFIDIKYVSLKFYMYYRAGLPASQLVIQRIKRCCKFHCS